MSPTECPTCGGPAWCWADRSDGVTVNFACDTPTCRAGKGPWDTPRPATPLGNVERHDGLDRCPCGCKYWEDDRCIDCGGTEVERPDVPADWPVQPLGIEDLAQAVCPTTCGACGRIWDDGISTGLTPAPAGRCPFEPLH